MPQPHSKQTGFIYSVSRPFTKHHDKIQEFRETGNLKHLYRYELDKAYFAHDAAYFESKDLAKKTISVKILKNRAYELARNRKYDEYQRALASTVYKFVHKKTEWGAIVTIKAGVNVNE